MTRENIENSQEIVGTKTEFETVPMIPFLLNQASPDFSRSEYEEVMLYDVNDPNNRPPPGPIPGIDLDILAVEVDVINGRVGTLEGDVANVHGDVANIQGDITTVQGDISSMLVAQKEFNLKILVDPVADQDYVLTYDAPFAGTITTMRTKTQSGTCTVTGKINTTALGGIANSATTTAQEQAHASANAFVKGDTIKVTVSANNVATLMEIHFFGNRITI